MLPNTLAVARCHDAVTTSVTIIIIIKQDHISQLIYVQHGLTTPARLFSRFKGLVICIIDLKPFAPQTTPCNRKYICIAPYYNL